MNEEFRNRLKDLHNRLKDEMDWEVIEYRLNELEIKDLCEFLDLFLYD